MLNIIEPGQSVVLIEQDKDANKAYRFSLAKILPPGDPLTSVTWAPSSGISISNNDHDATDAVAWFAGGTPRNWFSCVATWTSESGTTDQFIVRIFIKEDAELATQMGSALFPNKFAAVQKMRRDNLLLAAKSHFAGVELSNEFIWDKLRAAEADVSRTLRVKMEPTMFFPEQPSQDQIDALTGMPWELDEGYDYDPAMFTRDVWGMFITHSSPIIRVESLSFAYPANGGMSFDIPVEWIQLDRKYGNVRIVPLSMSAASMISPFVMQMVAAGRLIPNMVKITYVAGLENAAADYPDLVDAVKKMAVLKIIEDGFLPQSGSISGDGLSQSMSVDMEKYEDSVDRILNGRRGSNGGLRAAIHGITMGVM